MADIEDEGPVGKEVATVDRSDWIEPEDRETLTPWIALGIIMHDLNGYSWSEVCQKIRNGKGVDTIRRSARSPAGNRLRERITEIVDNPDKLARLAIQAHSLDVTADLLLALEWAKEVRDHRAVHAMTKDLLAMAGVTTEPKKQAPAPTAVHIHLGSSSLETPSVEATWTVLED